MVLPKWFMNPQTEREHVVGIAFNAIVSVVAIFVFGRLFAWDIGPYIALFITFSVWLLSARIVPWLRYRRVNER